MTAAFELHTERLRLAIPGPRAAQAQVRYYERNAEHLRPWEPPVGPLQLDAAQQARWLEGHLADARAGLSFRFLIFFRDDTEFENVIGHANLHDVKRGIVQSAILGYSVDRGHEGRGIVSEACAQLVRYAFETLGLKRLSLNYQPRNERSAGVARRLGFTIEGTARSYLYIDGEWRDHILSAKINPKDVTPA